MSGFKVENRTSESVQCSITNTTGGNAEWFNVAPGCNDTWKRAGWEDVKFRDPADTKFKSLRANRGEPAIIYFDGFDKPLTIVNTYQPAGFRVNNKSPQTVMVSVTSTTGGDNALFKLVPGQSDVWRRNGSETIRVQTEDGSKHAEGVFDNKGKMADVNFVDFSYSLVFRTGNANYIADEHYAEAARIAGSYYDKTQALDSHLTLAIPKVDALERAVHGTSLVG
ncbi:unnamed protein product [Mycena citricolor]|uniref:Uncharacterized protein n=1 Tax=Mycena citricolor TaxID=2018698 RepID=A0AAD2GUF3_9AGAR|nr:unnamed protein product [Mycena citricolor]